MWASLPYQASSINPVRLPYATPPSVLAHLCHVTNIDPVGDHLSRRLQYSGKGQSSTVSVQMCSAMTEGYMTLNEVRPAHNDRRGAAGGNALHHRFVEVQI